MHLPVSPFRVLITYFEQEMSATTREKPSRTSTAASKSLAIGCIPLKDPVFFIRRIHVRINSM